jgi:hypothetical protein
MVVHAVGYGAVWWYVAHRGHLLRPEVDRKAARATRIRFSLGGVAYPATVALALVSPTAMLAVHGLMAVYYAFNHLAVPARERPPTPAKPGWKLPLHGKFSTREAKSAP